MVTLAHNKPRAARIAAILEKYKTEQLGETGPVGSEDLVDLLTDIRHYCDAHGLELARHDRMAHENYLYELKHADA